MKPQSKVYNRSVADFDEAIQAHDIPEMEDTDAEKLLSVFFERIAKDRTLDGATVRGLVEEDVQDVVRDGRIKEDLRA